MNVDPADLGRVVGRIVTDLVDQRLGVQRPPKPQRLALSLAHVEKFVSAGKRVIRGLATTESLDRHGDRIAPMGGEWKLPVPLLWAHDHKQPIGVIREATASREGVRIVAEVVEGIAKADETWTLIQAGALDSFSIGFLGIEGKPISTGTHWTRWELLEISIVSVPSNPDAKLGKSGKGAVKLLGHPDYHRESSGIPGHPGAVRIVSRNK